MRAKREWLIGLFAFLFDDFIKEFRIVNLISNEKLDYSITVEHLRQIAETQV